MNWLNVDIASLRAAYGNGSIHPTEIVRMFIAKPVQPAYLPIWIGQFNDAQLLARASALEAIASISGIEKLPLYGVLVAVKDNIDVKGLPTTAACPAFSYMPQESATAIQLLEEAGAIIIGKTNLDQFATGLVGLRSPFGEVPNAFDQRYISGGSSSGSAVALALGQVHLAIGTDTAGSGRVPAVLNNLVGLKPSRGLISATGVVPACRTLDCVSIFSRTVADANLALSVMTMRNDDSIARRPKWKVPDRQGAFRLAIPRASDLRFFGDQQAEQAFADALKILVSLGATIQEIDFSIFYETAGLLYDGPYVAERLEAASALLRDRPQTIHPVVATVIGKGHTFTAADVFTAQYKISLLRKRAAKLLSDFDALVVPTIPTHYTRAEVNADPIALNSRLGTYTNAVNLLDLCALSVPTGFRPDKMPTGITLIAPALHDVILAKFGQQIQDFLKLPLGATGQAYPAASTPIQLKTTTLQVAVVGAHLSGMPLNYQLTERNAKLLSTTTTAALYRLYHLKDTVPPKPGLMRMPENGAAIQVEVWEMPISHFGSFVSLIPSPLGIGTILLADGSSVKSFICEPYAIDGARDITEYGSWKNYINSTKTASIS
ncbi:MAG TPA: allophanate hydrolase [Burkholderiaceae bacterium]